MFIPYLLIRFNFNHLGYIIGNRLFTNQDLKSLNLNRELRVYLTVENFQSSVMYPV